MVKAMNPRSKSKLSAVLATCAALVLLLPARPAAHEVPVNVTVLGFIKPEGRTLRLLVRAPAEAMRDINWPLLGPGYLDLSKAQPHLLAAAKTWIADYIEMYENGRRLPDGVVTAVRAALPSDRSFETYESALAGVHGPPLSADVQIPWQQAMIDAVIDAGV